MTANDGAGCMQRGSESSRGPIQRREENENDCDDSKNDEENTRGIPRKRQGIQLGRKTGEEGNEEEYDDFEDGEEW